MTSRLTTEERIASALERIADALERNPDQAEEMAELFRLGPILPKSRPRVAA